MLRVFGDPMMAHERPSLSSELENAFSRTVFASSATEFGSAASSRLHSTRVSPQYIIESRKYALFLRDFTYFRNQEPLRSQNRIGDWKKSNAKQANGCNGAHSLRNYKSAEEFQLIKSHRSRLEAFSVLWKSSSSIKIGTKENY